MFRFRTTHSSAVSDRPTLTIVSTTLLKSMLSLARSYRVSKSWKAAFLTLRPLSTLCLKGPRSTSSISSGRIWVSVSAKLRIYPITSRILFLKIAQLLWMTEVKASRAFFLTSMSRDWLSIRRSWISIVRVDVLFSLEPANLTLLAVVATYMLIVDLRPASTVSNISSGKSASSLPRISATMFRICWESDVV